MYVCATHHFSITSSCFSTTNTDLDPSLYIVIFPTLPDNVLKIFVMFDIHLVEFWIFDSRHLH